MWCCRGGPVAGGIGFPPALISVEEFPGTGLDDNSSTNNGKKCSGGLQTSTGGGDWWKKQWRTKVFRYL